MLWIHVRSERRCAGFSGIGMALTVRSDASALSAVGWTPRNASPDAAVRNSVGSCPKSAAVRSDMRSSCHRNPR